MHGDIFTWKNGDDKWYIDGELWIGNSWGTRYERLDGPFDTKEEASKIMKNWIFEDSRFIKKKAAGLRSQRLFFGGSTHALERHADAHQRQDWSQVS
jgi:hypothetical protein